MAPVGNAITETLDILAPHISTNQGSENNFLGAKEDGANGEMGFGHTTPTLYSMPSKILTTLLAPLQDNLNKSTVQKVSYQNGPFDGDDFFIPSLNNAEDDDVLRRFLNNSKVISDVPLHAGYPNSPLTAPELDLVDVSPGGNWTQIDGIHLLGAGHTDELAWLIPAVIGAIFVLVVLAYILLYGVKALETKCMRCCFRTFGCCRPGGGTRAVGDETDALTASMHQQTEMKAYSASSPSSNFDLGRFL